MIGFQAISFPTVTKNVWSSCSVPFGVLCQLIHHLTIMYVIAPNSTVTMRWYLQRAFQDLLSAVEIFHDRDAIFAEHLQPSEYIEAGALCLVFAWL